MDRHQMSDGESSYNINRATVPTFITVPLIGRCENMDTSSGDLRALEQLSHEGHLDASGTPVRYTCFVSCQGTSSSQTPPRSMLSALGQMFVDASSDHCRSPRVCRSKGQALPTFVAG